MNLPEALFKLLELALTRRGTEADINALVRIAYQFALYRLKQLMYSGRLHLQSFGIPLEGVAFDCIAELFQRDEDGEFIELKEYFSGERKLDTDQKETAVELFRRLVFSKLHHGLFRLYRENDPILSRILRNIKLALKSSRQLEQKERLGLNYIALISSTDTDQLPEIPIDELRAEMMARIRGKDSTKNIVAHVVDILASQDRYRTSFPLIDLALIVKRIATEERLSIEQIVRIDDQILEHDIEGLVLHGMKELEVVLRKRYLETGKIPAELFKCYIAAIREMMTDIYVRNDGTFESQPEYLKHQIENLTTEEYRDRHRTYFEYIVRLAKRHFQEQLRELL